MLFITAMLLSVNTPLLLLLGLNQQGVKIRVQRKLVD